MSCYVMYCLILRVWWCAPRWRLGTCWATSSRPSRASRAASWQSWPSSRRTSGMWPHNHESLTLSNVFISEMSCCMRWRRRRPLWVPMRWSDSRLRPTLCSRAVLTWWAQWIVRLFKALIWMCVLIHYHSLCLPQDKLCLCVCWIIMLFYVFFPRCVWAQPSILQENKATVYCCITSFTQLYFKYIVTKCIQLLIK